MREYPPYEGSTEELLDPEGCLYVREPPWDDPRRVVDLVRAEEWVLAARREADFAERDGYHTTAALLRGCADEIERLEREAANTQEHPA